MRLQLVFRYAVLIVLSVFFIFPLYWMITGSFKLQVELWSIPPNWFPSVFSLANYKHLFSTKPILLWMFNSMSISFITALFVCIFSGMAGYAYAKKRFLGSGILFTFIMITMMMPHQVTLVPLYMLIRDFGLIDNMWGVILPSIAFPFGVFLVRQFATTIPDEILESARIDGAGEIRIFLSMVVPLLLPALGALAIFSFMHTWNDYLWHLIVLQSPDRLTLPLGISSIAYDETTINYGYAMAGAAIAAVPMITIFLLLQKSFVKGITLGSVKG